MKPTDQDSLLAEIFSGTELENIRRTSMARSLAALRAKRRKRTALRIALAILIPALFAFTLTRRSSESPVVARHQTVPIPRQPIQSSPQAETMKTIGDDELLALFTDRGVALIGKPGNQRLMVFDKQSL